MTNYSDEVLLTKLEVRWRKLLESYHIDQQVGAPLFQEILAAYSEPHRQYHNLIHLNHMFQELDTYEADSQEADSASRVTNEMLWAVWYHDIVYKPGASTNEKKSAIKAKESMCQLGIQDSSIDKVFELIMATENHQTNTGYIDTQIFLDADMAILGADEVSYLNYCESVRQEHSSIPDFLFNRGRRKFLSKVLKQDSIFLSSFFYDQYEKLARKNIKSELAKFSPTGSFSPTLPTGSDQANSLI